MQGFEFAERQVLHPALTVRHALDRLVVRDDQLSAAADMHIQFHAVGSHVGSQFKGFQGILRRVGRGAAVTENQLTHTSTPVSV